MVTIEEIDDAISELRRLRRKIERANEAEKSMGSTYTTRHPVTGKEVSIGPVTQADVNGVKEDVESVRDTAVSKINAIDFDDIPKRS